MHRRACLAALALLALALPGCFLDWAPDGKELVLAWGKGQNAGAIALINDDGSSFRFIPGGDNGLAPSWSPDGMSIVFAAAQDGKAGDGPNTAYLYDVGIQKTRKLSDGLMPPYIWREDGRRFVGFRQVEGGGVEAVWYNLPDQGVTLHVKLPVNGVLPISQQTVWLPGTDDVAFIGGAGQSSGDVYTVEAGEVHKITTTGDVVGLGLSADHKRLVWARKGPNLKYILMSLYAMDLTKRNAVRLPFPSRVPALNPDPRHAPESLDYVTFSPDGARLALQATMLQASNPTRKRLAIYSLRMDGSDARLVRQSAPGETEGVSILLPVFSRDGKRLAIWAAHEQHLALAVYNADGSQGRRLLTQEGK